MSSLFTSLLVSANSLDVFGRAMNAIQNNVANVNTPGYAKHDLALYAQPFDPATGGPGGVIGNTLTNKRQDFLERAVRNQTQQLGASQQAAADLGQIEPLFDLNSKTGVSGSLNAFFGSMSQLSVNPNNTAARQTVLDQAKALAYSFNRAAVGVTQVANNIDSQSRAVVDGINRIAGVIAEINHQYQTSITASQDPALDAQAHSALEELAELTDFTVLRDPNGVFNIFVGGQTPVAIGDRALPITLDFSTPQTRVRNSGGNDITRQITSGRLGALLEEKNATLPGYMADLNALAASVADRVNNQLGQGLDLNGSPGSSLFAYDATAGAAFTLSVTGISPVELAAAAMAAPGGNGNAVAIAQMGDAAVLNGYTFAQFFGNLGGRVGRDIATARQDSEQQKDLVTQAQARRSEASGVSLDEEAVKLMQFQRAYEAAGKIVSVIDEMTRSVLDILR